MTALAIPWPWVIASAVAAAAALVALSMLKPETPSRTIPSIMLWLDTGAKTPKRVLFGAPARWLSLLLPLTALLSVLLALAEPVFSDGERHRRVVIAAPEAQSEALKFAGRMNPLDTAVLSTGGGGILLRDFAAPPLPCPGVKTAFTDARAALVLAEILARPDGSIYLFAADAPPFLPDNAVYVGTRSRSGETGGSAPKRLTVYPEGASPDFAARIEKLPGLSVAAAAAKAELAIPAGDREKFGDTLYRSGVYPADGGQRLSAIPERRKADDPAAFAIGTAAFLLAALAALADLWLWHKRKVI